MEPRLALCGNVFRADSAQQALAALHGPVAQWRRQLAAAGYAAPPGYGLYLSAAAAAEIRHDGAQLALLQQAIRAAGVVVWTANAFPVGGFHGARVKERAFLPDWRSDERLQFTRDVAEILARLLPAGSSGSLSTCPLGYGPEARAAEPAWDRLQRAHDFLLDLERRSGVRLILALEPEPDGAFERAGALCAALAQRLYRDLAPPQRRVGLCWDLCHSAVVGETPQELLAAAEMHGIPIGKVQVSAALHAREPGAAPAAERLRALAEDPYFHQARGTRHDGRPCAFADLPALLAAGDVARARIHCHVPLHRRDFGAGLRATDWRAPLRRARQAGIQDFEVETYTLPVLPADFLEREGMVGTMVAEMLACAGALQA